MKKLNEKFEGAFNTYNTTSDEKLKTEAFNTMVEMFNSCEILPDQYQEKYECLFPQMGDPSYCGEPVNLDEFFGFHVEL